MSAEKARSAQSRRNAKVAHEEGTRRQWQIQLWHLFLLAIHPEHGSMA